MSYAWSKYLGYGPGPGIQIVDRHVLIKLVYYKFPHLGVQDLSSFGVGLEKRERRDIEFKSQELLGNVVHTVQHAGTLIFNGVSLRVIHGMEYAPYASLKLSPV